MPAYVRVTQPAASGKKTCNGIESTCADYKGKDENEGFLLDGKSIGGTGEMATIEFSTEAAQEPIDCTGTDGFDAPEDAKVVFSPKPTIATLRGGPVTLTGEATFSVVNPNISGTISCEYTVRVRAVNGMGQ